MKLVLLLATVLFSISCTTTKIIQSPSTGSATNFFPLEEGVGSAADNHAKLSEYIKNSKSEFILIDIPMGEYHIGGTIQNHNKRLLIRGEDKLFTKLIFTNRGKQAILFTKTGSSYLYGSKMQDLTIAGSNSKSLIKIEKQRGFRLENVNFVGGDYGVEVDFVYDFLMSDCYVSQFKTAGLKFTSKNGTNTTCYVEQCHFEGAGDGIHVEGSAGLRIDKTIVQSNKIGLVELDNANGSTVFIRDSHFEGNKFETIKQKRSFKPGKSPSHINIENSYLLRGGKTEATSPVIYMDFGSLNIVNTSSSYKVGIQRSAKSIGAEYALDVVNNSFFENPIVEYFEYASKAKNQEYYKVDFATGNNPSGSNLKLSSMSKSRYKKSKSLNQQTNSISVSRTSRPGIFEVSASVPFLRTSKKSKISCSIYINDKLSSPEFHDESENSGIINIKDFIELKPKDKVSCKCKSNIGSFTILDGGHMLISRKSIY